MEKRIVLLERIGRVRVSTVWLGLDHGLGWSDEPLIFETMIFGGNHDGYQERYSTEEEARAGHQRAVELVKESSTAVSLLSKTEEGTVENPIPQRPEEAEVVAQLKQITGKEEL